MPSSPTPPAAPSSLQGRLEACLAARWETPVAVRELTRLAGGVSRETWAFEAEAAGGAWPGVHALVLRMDTAHPFILGSRATEFALLRWVREAGVPVPPVCFCETDPAVLGAPFLLMERVVGESRVGPLLREARYAHARAALPAQLAEALACIQRLSPAGAPPALAPLERHDPCAAVEAQEATYRERAVDPHPVLELAFRWLRAHLPPARPLVLVHGDFRPGNFLCDGTGLRAVLDWELAHFGDPLEDVAWLALRSWRGGADHLAVGGFATREAFAKASQAAGGKAIDPGALAFWDVFATTRWAVVTLLELGAFLAGGRNIELAALGRRTAEIEWDLLRLLERPGE
jgi:aminoglycoside phosphotransferase (APT) family kinase protein